MASEPLRGDVWLVRYGAGPGGEPGKNRPAVVVQASELAPYGPNDLVVMIPLSTSRPPSPAAPTIPVGQGVERESVAVCGAIAAVNRSRLLRPLGTVSEQTMAEISTAIRMLLHLG